MCLFGKTGKSIPLSSFFIALESLISPDENQFSSDRKKKVIRYVQFIADSSHCQPPK